MVLRTILIELFSIPWYFAGHYFSLFCWNGPSTNKSVWKYLKQAMLCKNTVCKNDTDKPIEYH